MHTYPGFNADDLVFGNVGIEFWIVNINTKEHVTVANVRMTQARQLIVDLNAELIYWCDDKQKSINSAEWDGTNRRLIHSARKGKCVCFLI